MKNLDLWKSFKENPSPELKQKIILQYQNLVHYVVKRLNLTHNLLDRRDFFQFGVEGMSEAVDRFDFNFGVKFETYAIPRIKGKILDEVKKYSEYPVFDTSVPEFFSTNRILSLNSNLSPDVEMQLYETISDGNPLPDQILEKSILKNKLNSLVEKELGSREKTILDLHYFKYLNYEKISSSLNTKITVSRISQIHSFTVLKLRDKLHSFC